MLQCVRFLRARFVRFLAFNCPASACAILLLLGLGTGVGASSVNPVFDSPSQPMKADVNVLAISTTIRDSSGNQDVYLVMLRLRGQTPQFARLIDTYPSYSKPIRRDVLTNHAALRMTLVRTPERDSLGQDVFLSADNRDVFGPEVRAALAGRQSSTIPCFTIVHGRTQIDHQAHTEIRFEDKQ